MRRFEFSDSKSNKFWEIDQQGVDVTTCWGRVGTGGQTKTKAFASEAAAAAAVEKQIASKTGKGYAETDGPAAPVAAAPQSTPAANDLADGEETTVAGSGASRYTLRNTGGVYSCTCPAWRNQSLAIDRRTCKHLRRFRGEAAEVTRLGALPVRAGASAGAGQSSSASKPEGPALLLAHRWDERDPTGWWMSEKLDGVRAFWDGKRFISRLGNEFLAPEWFIEGLPDFPLDGELFGGRKRFQQTVSIARRADAGEAWRALRFVIFDAPAIGGQFERRLGRLGEHFDAKPWALAEVLDHRLCTGVDDLHAELRRVEALGGEGLMLRQPGSRYIAGRSETLLKVKSFLDTEAKIVGHQPGTGRHKGRLGALELELPNGTRFKVGTGLSDAERDSPPALGEIITVRYQELTDAGVPRFPSYLGVRADIDWAALVAAARKPV